MERVLEKLVMHIENNGISGSLVEYPEVYYDDVTADTLISTFIANISSSNKDFELNMHLIEDLLHPLDVYRSTFNQLL